MFSNTVSRILFRSKFPSSTLFSWKKYSTDHYEPDYLASMQPDIPLYETMNVQIKGYDYSVLEHYQKFLHKVADFVDCDVFDAWAVPPKRLKIHKFKPASSVVEFEYLLQQYERNLHLQGIPSTKYPIFLRVLQETLPEGVSVNIFQPLPEHTKIRYIPDNTLKDLKQQLEEIGGPKKEKK